jgi:hypothetical protein
VPWRGLAPQGQGDPLKKKKIPLKKKLNCISKFYFSFAPAPKIIIFFIWPPQISNPSFVPACPNSLKLRQIIVEGHYLLE